MTSKVESQDDVLPVYGPPFKGLKGSVFRRNLAAT